MTKQKFVRLRRATSRCRRAQVETGHVIARGNLVVKAVGICSLRSIVRWIASIMLLPLPTWDQRVSCSHSIRTFWCHAPLRKPRSRSLHMVRAVLLNLDTMKVEHTLDWRVHDAQQYLWPIGHDQGSDSRRPGVANVWAGLKLKQKLTLGGPLAFVRDFAFRSILCGGRDQGAPFRVDPSPDRGSRKSGTGGRC